MISMSKAGLFLKVWIFLELASVGDYEAKGGRPQVFHHVHVGQQGQLRCRVQADTRHQDLTAFLLQIWQFILLRHGHQAGRLLGYVFHAVGVHEAEHVAHSLRGNVIDGDLVVRALLHVRGQHAVEDSARNF